MECRGDEGVVFMGVAFRELPVGLPVATTSVARSWTAGEHPLRILRSWDSPPADGSRSRENYHAGEVVRNGILPVVVSDEPSGTPPGTFLTKLQQTGVYVAGTRLRGAAALAEPGRPVLVPGEGKGIGGEES